MTIPHIHDLRLNDIFRLDADILMFFISNSLIGQSFLL